MGLILDTSVLVHAERVKWPVRKTLPLIVRTMGDPSLAISVLTLTELSQGLAGAQSPQARAKQMQYIGDIRIALVVHAVDAGVALRVGELNGDLRARGIVIGFGDLIIGVTALWFGYPVMTHNVKHFREIPGLEVIEAPIWS